MKMNILLLCLLLGNVAFSQNSDLATVCRPDGFCWEVSQVLVNGNWINACCDNIAPVPSTYSCEDDCDNNASAPPQQGGYTNYPTFDNVPINFTLPSGNDVWVFTNQELVEETMDDSSEEYQFLDEIEDYSFINESELEYAAIKINDNTYAVINNVGTAQNRKKSNALNSSLNEFELYPNPVVLNNNMVLRTDKSISDIAILNYQGKIIQNNNMLNGTGVYKISMPDNVSTGIYFLRITSSEGELTTQKFLVTD